MCIRLISASSSFGKQNAVPVSLQAGGGIPCRPNPAATLLVLLTSLTRWNRKLSQDLIGHNWISWVELSSKVVITALDRTQLNSTSWVELSPVRRCDHGLKLYAHPHGGFFGNLFTLAGMPGTWIYCINRENTRNVFGNLLKATRF